MTARVFVDTNVLVYCRDASVPEKQVQAMAWVSHLWSERSGRLSYQVLKEFYVTVTLKLRPGMGIQAAREDVQALLAWDPVLTDKGVLEGAWRIEDRYEVSCWDALIVSAAQAAGCRYLLTEDLQDGQDLDNLRVLNPFLHSVETVLA